MKEKIKSIELLKILEKNEVGANWFARDKKEDIKPALIKAYEILKRKKYIGSMTYEDEKSRMTLRQILCGNSVIENIEKNDFYGAYHELYDCIYDLGNGNKKDKYISDNEYVFYKSLIILFINKLEG
ncbi:hypothetical protein [Clostridium sulfidigenes]|uniref:hypothetical protein n=1 Tax=Clostridium sulfidigenes TaxID=318464 RepID=UPI003F8AC2FC